MNYFQITYLLLGLFLFPSCNSDYIEDYPPIQFQISIENDKNDNLLNPTVQGNILDTSMYMIFNEENYEIHRGWPSAITGKDDEILTRSYMAHWYGAYIAPAIRPSMPFDNPDNNYIFIGQFNGNRSTTIELQLIILNREYNIAVKNKLKSGSRNQQTFYLNGKKQDDNIIKIKI